MSALVDKTLHWKIFSGNINDTDTFPISFPQKRNLQAYGFVHEFISEFTYEFVDEFFANLSTNSCEFVQIRMNFLHEKLVMLQMACTVFCWYKCG